MPTAKLGRSLVTYRNSEEYHQLKQEIFTQDLYYFETDNPSPVIIDAGAHIGLATLYFKQLYPNAQVTAIEPHPDNFQLLEQNVFENQLPDITLVPVALSPQPGSAQLFADASPHQWYSTASFSPGAWNGQQQSYALSVPTVSLANYLTQTIDFMKMDIEGAEQAVLFSVGPLLTKIKHLMIEFHPTGHQSLPAVIEKLESLGFATNIWKNDQSVAPTKAKGLVVIEANQPD